MPSLEEEIQIIEEVWNIKDVSLTSAGDSLKSLTRQTLLFSKPPVVAEKTNATVEVISSGMTFNQWGDSKEYDDGQAAPKEDPE